MAIGRCINWLLFQHFSFNEDFFFVRWESKQSSRCGNAFLKTVKSIDSVRLWHIVETENEVKAVQKSGYDIRRQLKAYKFPCGTVRCEPGLENRVRPRNTKLVEYEGLCPEVGEMVRNSFIEKCNKMGWGFNVRCPFPQQTAHVSANSCRFVL
jgi:nitric oxide synthase oxygenase domain/subunit